MSIQKYSLDAMEKFLNEKYYIPEYQREYSWEESELLDFWNDLTETVDDSSKGTHFFGQIVVHNDEDNKKKYIIDGQQRTVTSIIFLRVLQLMFIEIYNESNEEDSKYNSEDIEIKLIGRKNQYHLTLSQLDRDYFISMILQGKPESAQKSDKKSCQRLKNAFVFFENKIKSEIEGLPSKQKFDKVNTLYKTFVEDFNVLYMESNKLDEAFIIFETLNARGKDLETADLLKNYIFGKSKDDIDNALIAWNNMIQNLYQTDPTKYIRHFWNSRSKFSRDKELYKRISDNINTPRLSKDFLKSLEKFSSYYHDMVYPDDASKFDSDDLISKLKILKKLKASTFYPIILAMLQMDNKFNENDIERVLSKIETYVFRNFTICKNVANTAEINFAKIAKQIYDEELVDTQSICDAIGKEIVDDTEFESSFSVWKGTESSKETIRYIFTKVHRLLDKNNEINPDTSAVHIEHIMPVDDSQWNVEQEIHEEYLWRLGNLALLSGKLNRQISNKPFDQKKYTYLESKIEPNKKIASNTSWGKLEIENRQVQLAKHAMKIWSKKN